jgi:CPA2 family monovalent cation:H+ antiporter-2
MHLQPALLLELGVILTLLGVLSGVARRLGISAVPLYLLAGLSLGEGGLAPVPAAGQFVEVTAVLGVVLLLLTLGLEFSAEEFSQSLRRHVPSALVDLVLCATPGALAGLLLGLDTVAVLALAGATWISSSSIAARVLQDLGRLGNRETPSVLAILVLEDFAMAAYLPLLSVLAVGGSLSQALAGSALAVGCVTLAFVVTRLWGEPISRTLGRADPEALMLRVLGGTLVVAALAELISASAAVGAFVVGLMLTGEVARAVRGVLEPLRDLFAAAFFVSIGLFVHPEDLLPMLPAAALLALVGIASKLVVGAFAAARDGVARRGRLRAGATLVARGEFSIVIVGLAATTDPRLGPLVTAYVVILAILGPILAQLVSPRSPILARSPE